jgi:hypothetical protein
MCAAAPAEATSVADWRHDLDELLMHVQTTHPDPFTKVGELTFMRAVQALSDELPRLTEEQRVVRVMAIMAMLGDAHSMIEPHTEAFAAWYPLRIVEFTDGYFITAAHESIADISGAQVLSIAGRPVSEVAEAARDLISADNEWWRRESLYAMFNAGLMKGLGFAAQDTGVLTMRLRLRNGRVVERRIAPVNFTEPFEPEQASLDWLYGRTEISGPWVRPSREYISAFRGLRGADFYTLDASRPPHLSLRSLNALPLPAHDAYYIMLNLFHDSETETLPDFFARAMREVDAQRPRRLIIDLRENPGGDGSNGGPIVRELIARQRDQPWRELYILVGGRTYSAAQLVLYPLLQNVQATMVGEPMGGSWQMFGDYSTFQLERIGMELRVSALRHSLSESTDLRTVIPVDYPARFSFRDYIAGRDPAVDPILAGEEVRSITTIALADGGAAARRAYLERRARFANLSWWAPPTEPELRRIGDELTRAGRTADAIETFRLSSEIHPDEWRSWYNLAEALRANGQMTEALIAYRACIALNDPTNFNQASLVQLVGQVEAR